jgi:hypothetical protein
MAAQELSRWGLGGDRIVAARDRGRNGILLQMYGPPRDCKGKVWARRQVCANVYGLWLETSSPGQDELRACPSFKVGRSLKTIFRTRLRTRRCDCSFVLATPCRLRWGNVRRRGGAGKWERAALPSRRRLFRTVMREQLLACSRCRWTGQPMQCVPACSPWQRRQRSWVRGSQVHRARLRWAPGRA